MEDNLFLKNLLKKLYTLFYFSGIYITSDNDVSTNRLKYRLIYFLHCFAANYHAIASIVWCIDGLKNGEDFLNIVYTIPCLTINTLGQFKCIFLIKHEKMAQKLISNMKKLDEQDKKRKQFAEKDDIVKSDAQFLNYVLKTLSISYLILLVGFSFSPLVVIVAKYFQTQEVELVLPFFAIYGFDPMQKIIWPFMYIHQCWSEVAVTVYICSADYFFFTCCTYIRIQFRLLRHDLENLIPDDIDVKFVEDESFKRNFNELIKWHQDLIESANILEIIYSKSTLLNFVSSSLIICLTGFNVTMMTNDIAFMMTFLCFLFMSLVQVFFLCFFADLLMISSMEISEAAYNSRWYMAEAKIGKNMLLVLSRAQKPCKITACGFTDVHLNSFMRILSTSYSYFTLLQTMYAE